MKLFIKKTIIALIVVGACPALSIAADVCDGRQHIFQQVINYPNESNLKDEAFDVKPIDRYTTSISVKSACVLLFDIKYYEEGKTNKLDHDTYWTLTPYPQGSGATGSEGTITNQGRYSVGAIAELRINGETVLHQSDGNWPPPFAFGGAGTQSPFDNYVFKCHSRPALKSRCDQSSGCSVELMRWNANAETTKLIFTIGVQKTDDRPSSPRCSRSDI